MSRKTLEAVLTSSTEYIGQLEAEITQKVNENGDLRAQNRALLEENKRLSDLTRMLLGSPSFSDFLDRLSSNAAQMIQAPAPQQQVAEPRREARQVPKDVNPYAAQQQLNGHQQIGMAMIPEQSIDMSMLGMSGDASAFYEPQVFTVETPEIHVPEIDTSLLSGKSSNFVGPIAIESEDEQTEKVEMPVIVHPVEQEPRVTEIAITTAVDEAFENDPAFALYHETTTSGSSRATLGRSSPPGPSFSPDPLLHSQQQTYSLTVNKRSIRLRFGTAQSLTSTTACFPNSIPNPSIQTTAIRHSLAFHQNSFVAWAIVNCSGWSSWLERPRIESLQHSITRHVV